jgi:hypothetical protein
MEELIKKLSPRLIGTAFVCVLLYLSAIITIALARGQPVDLWGLKIGRETLVEQPEARAQATLKIGNLTQDNRALQDRISVLNGEIDESRKRLEVETAIRITKEKRLIDLEQEFKSARVSNLNQLAAELHSLRVDIEKDESRLAKLHDQFEALSKDYYANLVVCRKGESFYNQECKKAGELQGAVEGVKLRIDHLTKLIAERTQLYKTLLEQTKVNITLPSSERDKQPRAA